MQLCGEILQQENARPHFATQTIETINQIRWELLGTINYNLYYITTYLTYTRLSS